MHLPKLPTLDFCYFVRMGKTHVDYVKSSVTKYTICKYEIILEKCMEFKYNDFVFVIETQKPKILDYSFKDS